jgi:hypothetical protein
VQHLLQHQHQRPLLKKPRSPLASNYNVDDNDDDYDDVYQDIHVGHRRPRVIDEPESEELSEHVLFRLFLARQLALMKYKEKWA